MHKEPIILCPVGVIRSPFRAQGDAPRQGRGGTTASIIEMENKIPQIEFVDMNVDELMQQWSGKPDNQAPMHVRQLLWLKENAEKFGYEQSGNSWKLK